MDGDGAVRSCVWELRHTIYVGLIITVVFSHPDKFTYFNGDFGD